MPANEPRTGPAAQRRIGFHVSIEGGLPEAIPHALERECTALQVFAGNPRGWALQERTPLEFATFRKARAEAELQPLVVHACYLINPCAPDRDVFAHSVRRLARELSAAFEMDADYYVIHPGSPRGKAPSRAVRRAAKAFAKAAERASGLPMILLENTAGDYGPGGSFETLAALKDALQALDGDLRVGLCIDSCHAFTAGYDFRDAAGADRMVEDIRRTVGLEAVRLIHVNDSRDEPGSRRDRHAHIGRGTIGLDGLRNLILHPAFAGLPLILETPWESLEDDLANIRAVRALL